MSAEKQILKEIESSLDVIKQNETKALNSLLRKTEVYIKKVHGEKSDYLSRYCELNFIPREAIYNSQHYRNEEAWNSGISNFKGLLELLNYELYLKIDTKSEMEFPDKITFSWLKAHVPLKYWIAFAGLLMSAFLAGVAFGELNLSKIIKNGKSNIETVEGE